MTRDDPAILDLAKSYPYARPDHSYLFVDGEARSFQPPDPAECRHAVLAIGSNAAPRQLARKFQQGPTVIPVERGWLTDFLVVYSAHFTSYGALPATLQHVPGARTEVFVTHLTDDQLDRMHRTEAMGVNYGYAHLEGLDLTLSHGGRVDHARTYLSLHGCLDRDGACVPLARVPAETGLDRLTEAQALTHVRDRLSPEAPLDRFIGGLVRDAQWRRALTARLDAEALPFAWPRWTIVKTAL